MSLLKKRRGLMYNRIEERKAPLRIATDIGEMSKHAEEMIYKRLR